MEDKITLDKVEVIKQGIADLENDVLRKIPANFYNTDFWLGEQKYGFNADANTLNILTINEGTFKSTPFKESSLEDTLNFVETFAKYAEGAFTYALLENMSNNLDEIDGYEIDSFRDGYKLIIMLIKQFCQKMKIKYDDLTCFHLYTQHPHFLLFCGTAYCYYFKLKRIVWGDNTKAGEGRPILLQGDITKGMDDSSEVIDADVTITLDEVNVRCLYKVAVIIKEMCE